MEQPWQDAPQAAPDADDLPLAGLLAELLAASESEPAASAGGEAADIPVQPSPWMAAEPAEAVEAGQVLQILDDAGRSEEAEPGDLSGLLLARLMGGDETPAEAPALSEYAAVADSAELESAASAAVQADEGAAPEALEIAAADEAPAPLPSQEDWNAAVWQRLSEEAPEAAAEPLASAAAGDAPEALEISAEDEAPVPLPSQEDWNAAVWQRLSEEAPEAAAEPPLSAASSVAGGESDAALADCEAVTLAAAEDGQVLFAEAGADESSGEAVTLTPEAGSLQEPVSSRAAMAEPEFEPVFAGESAAPPAGFAAMESVQGQEEAAIPQDEELSEAAGAGEPATAGPAEFPVLAGAGSDAGQAEDAEPVLAEEQSAAQAPETEVLSAAAVAPAIPAAGHASPAVEEDEFELVDAAQVEQMVDRLLDAARSAIRGTPVSGHPEESEEPVLEAASGLAQDAAAGGAVQPEPLPAPAESGVAAGAALPETPAAAGFAAAEREPVPDGPAAGPGREERLADVSPIPPAVMLMALGLPERLRARLQSLGDVERILQSQPALSAVPEQRPRLLVFQAGGESYALSMESVREVERLGRVTPVPGAPPFIRGLVNLRGEILPLIDLAALIGKKPARSAQRLIVAQAGAADPVVALLVEELNGLAPLEESQVEPPQQPGPLRGSLEHRGRRVLWLEPAAVFGAEALDEAAAAVAEAGR
jgi:purine-binding chemotaxis protein CheW